MKNDPFSDLHWHYKVQGYEKMIGEEGRLWEVVTIHVVASNEKEAINKAKEMIKKKHYRITEAYEHHMSNSSHELSQDMQMTQLKMQKQMLDLVKGNIR